MRDTLVHLTSWRKVALAAIPGLVLVLLQSELFGQITDLLGLALVLSILCIVVASFVLERHLSSWCLPPVGILHWLVWYIVLLVTDAHEGIKFLLKLDSRLCAILGLDPGWPLLIMWYLFIAIGVAVSIIAYRKSGARMPVQGWGLVGFLFLLTSLSDSTWLSFGSLSTGMVSFITLVVSSALSLLLARRDGLTAGLLIAVCEPAWVYVFLNPLNSHGYAHEFPQLHWVFLLLSVLPLLCFLVIIPIGVLRSRSRRNQARWLLWPTLLTLLGISIIRYAAVQSVMSFQFFLRQNLIVLQLWLPLLWVMWVCGRRETNKAQDVPASAVL